MTNQSKRRGPLPLNLLIPVLFLLLLGLVLLAGATAPAAADLVLPSGQSSISAIHMAEVEVEASAGTLALLDSMGITTRPAGQAGHVLADVNNEQELRLMQEGIAHTVARRFFAAQGSGDNLSKLSYSYVGGTNITDLFIPDNGVLVKSPIVISGIPDDNLVTGVDLHVTIQHPLLRDLIVEIHDPGESVYTLLNRDPGSSPTTDIWKSNMPHWRGRQGNGTWQLWASDDLTNLQMGYVDMWSMRVYYGPISTPTPTPTCPMGFSCLPTVRINAGGPAYVDSTGQTWQPDRTYAACTSPYFGNTGGDAFANLRPIDGTNDDALYQTQRYFSSPAAYVFDVPNGAYSVTLRFAEIYPSIQVGERVFDVDAEGQRVADALDVIARTGARYRALDIGFTIPVTDGQLNLNFTGRPNKAQPFISAIKVEPIACGAATATPTPTFTPTPTATPPQATPTATATTPAGQAELILAPDGGSYTAGQTFLVDIVINAGSQQVDGAQAFLSFDPTVLVVVDAAGNPTTSIIPGAAFTNYFANSVNNGAGTIDYSDGIQLGAAPLTGRVTLATIRFKGILPSPDTDVLFSRTWPRESKFTLSGVNVLGSSGAGSYQISGGILQGTMQIAGRPTPPGNTEAVPLNVKFYAAGTSTLVHEVTVSSNANGAFTVLPVANGSYDIVLKHSQTLSVKKQNVTFSGGVVTVSFGMLPVGDANNDDLVDISDFSILRAAFLKTCGQGGFDGRADFNADCVVDITDFSLLHANFLRNGPIVDAATLSGRAVKPNGNVVMSLQPASAKANLGDIFVLEINVAAGTQQVDGAQAVLAFDPTTLQVVDAAGNPTSSITAGSAMDSHFSNSADNSTGRILYSEGQLSGAALTGSFTLASIRFKAIGPGMATVAFDTTNIIHSKITFGGLDVLSDALNGRVVVGSNAYSLSLPTLILNHPPEN